MDPQGTSNRYFDNARDFVVTQNVIGNVQEVQHNEFINNPPIDPFLLLWTTIKDVGGSHEAEARQPPPKCEPGTREASQKFLSQWARTTMHPDLHEQSDSDEEYYSCDDEDNQIPLDHHKPICWLNGTVGVGKSAVAQSVAEALSTSKNLVASFFFSRNVSTRNTATYLFLLIAYGLGQSHEDIRSSISATIQQHPAVLSESLEKQFELLILDPCLIFQSRNHGWRGRPRLVIIDGLDECQGSKEQRRVLNIIVKGVEAGIPLRFLITSRPEYTIQSFFDSPSLRQLSERMVLKRDSQTDRDIHLFLVNKFTEIRSSPRHSHYTFPEPWPSSEIIDDLVNRSDGQFIYASTVVKYVDSEYFDPIEQLDTVLGLTPSLITDDEPFSDLDLLYHQSLSRYPARELLLKVLGFVVALPTFERRVMSEMAFDGPFHDLIDLKVLLAELLNMKMGNIVSLLRTMDHVVDQDTLRPHHASFTDFCKSRPRSRGFYIDAEYYHSVITAGCVGILNRVKPSADLPLWSDTCTIGTVWKAWGDMVVTELDSPLGQGVVLDSLRALRVDLLWNASLKSQDRPKLPPSVYYRRDRFGSRVPRQRPDFTGVSKSCHCKMLVFNFYMVSEWLKEHARDSEDLITSFESANAGFHVWISHEVDDASKHDIFQFLEHIVPYPNLIGDFSDPCAFESELVQVVSNPSHCQCLCSRALSPETAFTQCAESVYFFSLSTARALFFLKALKTLTPQVNQRNDDDLPSPETSLEVYLKKGWQFKAKETGKVHWEGTSFLAQCYPHKSLPPRVAEIASTFSNIDWIDEILLWFNHFPAKDRPEAEIRIYQERRREILDKRRSRRDSKTCKE